MIVGRGSTRGAILAQRCAAAAALRGCGLASGKPGGRLSIRKCRRRVANAAMAAARRHDQAAPEWASGKAGGACCPSGVPSPPSRVCAPSRTRHRPCPVVACETGVSRIRPQPARVVRLADRAGIASSRPELERPAPRDGVPRGRGAAARCAFLAHRAVSSPPRSPGLRLCGAKCTHGAQGKCTLSAATCRSIGPRRR